MILRLLLFLIVLGCFKSTYSQQVFRGIVVDSATMAGLQSVHIKKKNSPEGTTTDSRGMFVMKALPTDTLLFTLVGYKPLLIPLLFEEETLIIRLPENISLLKEITITANRLGGHTIVRSQRTIPRVLPDADPTTTPFDYFSKWQRERRKLVKLIRENDRTITYLQVVSDPEVREEIIEEYAINEREYYALLAEFNKQSEALQYNTNHEVIKKALVKFIMENIEKKR